MYMSRYWSLFYRFALKGIGPYKRKMKTWPVSMSILNLGWIYIRRIKECTYHGNAGGGRGGGRQGMGAWDRDLIVFVGPGVGHFD